MSSGIGHAQSKFVSDQFPGVSLNVLLAFGAILVAAMQGMLVLESADPCRISHRKLKILLFLEVIEVLISVAAEILSCVEVIQETKTRLQWLAWFGPAMLVFGLMQMALDVLHTVMTATLSRHHWLPYSAQNGRRDRFKPVENASRCSLKIMDLPDIFVLLSVGIPIFIAGWRQGVWLRAPAVPARMAIAAAADTGFLSVGAIAASVAFAFCTASVSLVVCAYQMRPLKIERLLKRFRGDELAFLYGRKITENLEREQANLREIQMQLPEDYQGSSQSAFRRDAYQLDEAPLHIGNAIVGIGRYNLNPDPTFPFYGSGVDIKNAERVMPALLFIAEHFSIFPLQMCVLGAICVLWKRMDTELFAALKEVSGVILVFSFIEIAIFAKRKIWGIGGGDDLRDSTV